MKPLTVGPFSSRRSTVAETCFIISNVHQNLSQLDKYDLKAEIDERCVGYLCFFPQGFMIQKYLVGSLTISHTIQYFVLSEACASSEILLVRTTKTDTGTKRKRRTGVPSASLLMRKFFENRTMLRTSACMPPSLWGACMSERASGRAIGARVHACVRVLMRACMCTHACI